MPMNKDYLQLEFDSLGNEANYKLADPTLVDYYKRLNNREILINQDIDDGIVEWTQGIVEWNREDKDIAIAERKPIKIWINSNGGSLNAINELINICNLSRHQFMLLEWENVTPQAGFCLWVSQGVTDIFCHLLKHLFMMALQVVMETLARCLMI